MSWLGLLGMLGKGLPTAGAPSFTALHCHATPGRYRAFNAKAPSGVVVTMEYFLRHLARIG